jgi:hypothetical protein
MIYGPDFGSAAIGDIGIINGGRFDSWHTARPIGQGSAFFAREDIPWYNALWDAFVFADQSFASALSMTNPNLLHLFSGSSGWSVGTPAPLNNDEPLPGFLWETIGETLEAAGVSWKVRKRSAWRANARVRCGQTVSRRGRPSCFSSHALTALIASRGCAGLPGAGQLRRQRLRLVQELSRGTSWLAAL